MKRTKLIVIAIVLAVSLLAACSKSNAPASTGNSSSSQSAAQTPQSNTPSGGGLFDIKDSDIKVESGDLSALPDYLKKGIGGRLGYATLTSSNFLVSTYDVKKEQMRDLRDYYASNCGTVIKIDDEFIDDMGMFEIIYDWGQINAVMNTSSTGGTTVTAMFR